MLAEDKFKARLVRGLMVQSKIATKYGVSQSLVSMIQTLAVWKHRTGLLGICKEGY